MIPPDLGKLCVYGDSVMEWRIHITLTLAFLFSAAVSTAGQTEGPKDSVLRATERTQAERACIEGRSFGTDLLSVADRVASCTALSNIDGSAYTGLYYRARARMSARDWTGAVEDFSAAVALNPQAADAIFERGRVQFLYLERADIALEDFARATLLAPGEASYLMMQALAAIQLAKQTDGEEIALYVDTARDSLEAFLELTDGTDDITRQVERDAAKDILERLARIN